MAKILDVDITTAITAQIPGNQDNAETVFKLDEISDAANIMAVFDSGTGGTDVTAWVQSSLDGGASWFDVAAFNFLTTDATKISAVTKHLAPTAQAYAPSDGALADNTVAQGVFGKHWRVKVTTTGTYTGANLKVFVE